MIKDLMYIELKAGYSDNGPAWIGYVKTSKTKKTIYFNDHAFQKYNGGCSNYVDIETGDEYWISGLKKKESNRHWDGHGKIMIDQRCKIAGRTDVGCISAQKTHMKNISFRMKFGTSVVK